MASNKHATIRYNALDKCFSNFGRRYYIEDLIEACSKAIYDFTGKQDGVKRRQIYDDITFMESEQGWSIPLQRIKDGRRVYFQYEKRDFSIKNQALSSHELQQLNDALSHLSRFTGMAQFEWIEETIIRLRTSFGIRSTTKPIVGFEQNPYLKGLSHFAAVFNAIQYKRAIEVTYKGFRQEAESNFQFHPYYLKQYNNRWFVFGWNNEVAAISNLALDRVLNWKETAAKYRDNSSINFEEYFEDVIGVSILDGQEPQKIILRINKQLWPYIETKPLHGSQKNKESNAEHVIIELNVMINYELISTVLSFGDGIKVIEPEELMSIVVDKVKRMLHSYN